MLSAGPAGQLLQPTPVTEIDDEGPVPTAQRLSAPTGDEMPIRRRTPCRCSCRHVDVATRQDRCIRGQVLQQLIVGSVDLVVVLVLSGLQGQR